MGRRRKSNDLRSTALELWQAPSEAGEPVVCIAATYTFDATFFETECLGRFLQMDTHPDENERIAYLIEREEKLASARVTVLVDRRHAQSKESLRWDVLPVIVPSATQHAKLSVLCWASHVRVIIGSGNLTQTAYRENLEVFGSIEASREEGGQVKEIMACLDFLDEVIVRASGDFSRPGPKQRAKESVRVLRARISAWPQAVSRNARIVPAFGGAGRSSLDQLRDCLPGGPPRAAKVLSPFFDRDNSAQTVASLVDHLAQRGPRSIEFYFAYEDLPDGRLRVFAPAALIEKAAERCEVKALKVPRFQDDASRPLHAKMIALANDQWEARLIGSSNFTRAGLTASKATNLEANLVYVFRVESDEHHLMADVWPQTDGEIDIDDDEILWETVFDAHGEREAIAPLPAAFIEALFDAANNRLIIALDESLPAWWIIKGPNDEPLIDSVSCDHCAGEHVFEWGDRALPFVLAVEWKSARGEFAADWPVNVLNPSSLAPPEDLSDLSLDDLIAILQSTRPLHEAVTRSLRRKTHRRDSDVHLDPHKRVNTESYLLRRTKRAAIALDRLRERLEKPAATLDAFDWRLRGPVGPLALASAFQKEARSTDEARFLLAELALALSRVRISRSASGGVDRRKLRERIQSAIEEIEKLAGNSSGDDSTIDSYVAVAFTEAKK